MNPTKARATWNSERTRYQTELSTPAEKKIIAMKKSRPSKKDVHRNISDKLSRSVSNLNVMSKNSAVWRY
eukprot:CAMPEP_0185570772 /NCGR_PEP_ID=MMETSP0434-20130131/2960_1 /TAXON_ID=626734 ORGANISM="Favella taraikaensis, Strain Fe Narragansett Bay" /NCGR_SAMPLE_ID=MMETSP0434 /ASSEMBLY_ACC=CAM_ASM_000379 /LENGTH=69 /DNA_ID=CAMNT_0028185973 /DNA_START=633 /DNA_END=842 /DNA_ORIENTATION=+